LCYARLLIVVIIIGFLSTDGESTFGTRIESLDSTRVEDMVHEYFAKADEVISVISRCIEILC